jgi:hypothetical protein
MPTDKKEKIENEMRRICNVLLKNKFNNWRNGTNREIRINGFADISLLRDYVCIRFFGLPYYYDYHLHINLDGSFYFSNMRDVVIDVDNIKILRNTYKLLKRLAVFMI